MLQGYSPPTPPPLLPSLCTVMGLGPDLWVTLLPSSEGQMTQPLKQAMLSISVPKGSKLLTQDTSVPRGSKPLTQDTSPGL